MVPQEERQVESHRGAKFNKGPDGSGVGQVSGGRAQLRYSSTLTFPVPWTLRNCWRASRSTSVLTMSLESSVAGQ